MEIKLKIFFFKLYTKKTKKIFILNENLNSRYIKITKSLNFSNLFFYLTILDFFSIFFFIYYYVPIKLVIFT
jgi:hypothetical protein